MAGAALQLGGLGKDAAMDHRDAREEIGGNAWLAGVEIYVRKFNIDVARKRKLQPRPPQNLKREIELAALTQRAADGEVILLARLDNSQILLPLLGGAQIK